MNHNGYNEYCKKGLGNVRIGSYVCPICEEPLGEYRIFGEQLKNNRDAEIEVPEEMTKEEQEMRLKGDTESGGVAVKAFVSPPGKTPKPTAKTRVL